MSPIKILEDALSAGKDFGSLASRLRDKFKSGTADLQAVYDEASSVIDSAVAKAKDGLAAFKAEVEKVEQEAEGKVDGAGDEKDETPVPVVDLSAGTTTHTATDGTITTLDHEAGTVTAVAAEGFPVVPASEVVTAVVQAATDAGVAVPDPIEQPASGASTAEPAAQPVI